MKGKKFTRNWRKNALSMLLVSFTLSTACGLASCKEDEPVHVPGLGVFYYDTGSDEYQLALEDNYNATFIAKGESKSATYKIEGDVLTLTFDDGSTMQATLAGNELTLNYDDGQYKFLKKIYYTVSYEEVGGSDVPDAIVVNGQTFVKPDDPEKEGHQFLGWYADSEYKIPYSFEQVVTGNMTLYAQWASLDPSMEEYVVDFDLGYETDTIAELKTYAGKIYDVPTPTRDGYKFCGWWISAYENGEKLTYKYTPDTVFKANTTLFALWESDNLGSKLSAPEVEVTQNGVSWNGVSGVSVYKLKVTGPRGFSTVDEDVSGTNYTIDFASAPAGDYEITVTAAAQSGAENNSETVKRYYQNKAVGRVSKFTVLDGNVLLFNRAENATTYYITIDCGNDLHTHTTYNLGDSTHFNFSACEMQEGGIRFTVTAAADGYASTTSETFVYNRVLDKVTGLAVNEDTQVLSWYPVANATRYIVTVTCGDETHTHEVVNNGTKTSFSLKECPADANGQIKVSVYAETAGYNSPEATELVYNKTKLASPSNVTLVNENGVYKLNWKEVAGATGYTVKVGNVVRDVTTNELDITTELSWVDGEIYNVEIKATSDTNESVWSDATKIYYGVMSTALTYKSGMVNWQPVVGATGYQVRVESGEIQNYGANVTSAPVTFAKEGTNVIYVRFAKVTEESSSYSEWVQLKVENVQAIYFDVRGGKKELDPIYKAMGDKLDLPTPEKDGYTFAGWYNTPKGPESNGDKYDDEYFAESSELVLYAYWTNAGYEVTYEVGAHGELGVATGNVTYLKDFKFDVPTVEDTSKVFLGWFAGPDSSAQQLTDDRGYSLRPWNLKQGATVYAQYVSDVLSFTLLEDGTYSVSKGRNIHKITSVTIPETYNSIPVTVVDGYAFEARSNIVSITIPDTVKIIERETAFYGCNGLQEINVYHVDGNNTPVFSSVDGVLLKKDDLTGQTQLFYYPLAKKGTYTIPDGVTEIPLNLFRGSQISEVVIPTSVAIIRGNAFRECAKLTKVTFAEGGTDSLTIEDGAFNSCISLEEITLPSRLAELQINEETRTLTLFEGCDALSYINVEKGSATYGSVEGVLTNSAKNKLIYCPAARSGSYTIPRGIIEVGERAFYNCNRLTQIIIPGYVESIGEYAFYGCSRASRIEFSDGAIAGMELIVGDYAFADMSNLKIVEFKEGSAVAQLGKYAFANATGLRNLTIPATMALIDDYAFDNASALATVTFEENGRELTFGNYVFNDCKGLTKVNLPASVKKLNLGVFDGCINISEIKVATDNENYKDIDGIVFSKDGKELVFFPKGRQSVEADGSYVIPVGVESISEGAFKGMRYITKIVINNTITHIGKGAFANSLELATLDFESGNDDAKLTIGESAFEGCSKVQTIALPTRAEIIEAKAFYNVSISSITFPAGVTTIGDYAFAKSSLNTVEIPAGLEKLGTNVFEECVNLKVVSFAEGFNATEIPVGTFQKSGLTTIEIPGSIEKIGYMAFNDCVDLTNVTFANGTADLIIGYLPEGMDAGDEGDGKEDGKEEGKDKEQGNSLTGVFKGCTKLTTIDIPDRTILIGYMAFSNCTALSTVNVTENSRLQRMGTSAFASTAITSFYIPKTVENTPYVDENTVQELAIGNNAFYNTNLKNITFAMGGTGELSIGREAFENTPITSITLPKRLAPVYTTYSGAYVTWEGVDQQIFTTGSSSPLKEINIEEGGAYYGSKDGVLYKVKDGVLNEMMFVPVQKTGSITVPKTVTLFADRCAQYSKVSEIIWEDADNADGLPLTIGNNALQNMPNLKNVRFPERTVAIGSSMFYGSSCKVQTVYIPANVETIGESMFRDCTTVTEVTFADGCKITAIPNSMFYRATKLKAIRVPANVEKIGTYAFRECSSVTSFSFEEGSKITTLSGAIFQGMKLTELTIPDGVSMLDGNVFTGMSYLKTLNLSSSFSQISTIGNQQQSNFLFDNCTKLEAVNIPEENQYFKSVDGVVFTKDGKTLVYYPRAKKIGNLVEGSTTAYDGVYVTPAGVQTIGTYAFKSNSNIKELVVSADLLFIGWESFASSSVAKLTFAERASTLVIGDRAFNNCTRLGNAGKDTLTIPAEVEVNGDWAFANTRYGYIHFEDDNTTTTLQRTFQNNSYLKEVTNIPDGITSMDATFLSCKKLTKVGFAEDAYVTTMQGTFYGCAALTSITIPKVGTLNCNGAKQGAFENCTKLASVNVGECGYIGEDTFYGCTALTSFDMPDSVSQMGVQAFYNCTALTSIKLSSGLEEISKNAFYGCSKLESVEIGGFVTTIGENAFKGCVALKSVILPDGLVTIGNSAFENAKLVQTLVIPDGVKTIGDNAFKGWSALKEINIPASVTSIGASAFSGCSSVEAINIPEGALLESIGDYAFENIVKVSEFFIPATLTNLGIGVFTGWSTLDNITVESGNLEFAFDGGILYNATYTKMILVTPNVPETLEIRPTITALARGIFVGLNVKKVVLPDTIEEIPSEAFRGCTALEEVKMPKYLKAIGDAAFEGCVSLKSIDIPASVRSTFEKKSWGDMGKDGTFWTFGWWAENDVDGIGAYAFANCTALEEVNFIEGGAERLSIGDYAFYNCSSLTTMKLPNRLRGEAVGATGWNINGSGNSHAYGAQGIGAYAFARCRNLKSVEFEETGIASFTEKLIIGIGAFTDCANLESVTFNSAIGDMFVETVERETVKHGTSAIQARAFDGCTALKTVTFANGYDFTKMTAVASAFEDCKELTLPKELQLVEGSFYSQGGKENMYSTMIDTMFQIDGCTNCKNGCEFFDGAKDMGIL
ncbi:MAG: hypothetical protein E7381_01450 [Clostridiales bacterium]|nr:hypothetical protein [Clostridiales bacterium]